MKLYEAQQILKENGFLLEQFDNNYFSKCFKASKLNKLFSIERDNVFRLDGPSFWIVSNKNPGDKYLVRVGGKKMEQYVNYKKVDEIEFGDEYDIILILKHKLETGKLVNFVNGEMIDYHMTEAKEILKNHGYLVETYEDRADDIINKYCNGSNGTLEEIENNIEKELGKKPKVSTDRINQVIWIKTDEFTIIGYYQFDEDTGITYVNPQTVEFPNEEPDYIDDPVYGLNTNK